MMGAAGDVAEEGRKGTVRKGRGKRSVRS